MECLDDDVGQLDELPSSVLNERKCVHLNAKKVPLRRSESFTEKATLLALQIKRTKVIKKSKRALKCFPRSQYLRRKQRQRDQRELREQNQRVRGAIE